MRELYMKNGQGFVLVYSITSQRSLDELDEIRIGIIRHKNSESVPIILVGNKCDLEHKREVLPKDGKDLARDYNCPWMETSAKNDINIVDIFHSLIDQVWQQDGAPNFKKRKRDCVLL
eukprot:TRINITY_DN715_c0_g1_i1.p4 TRINITY_DN715_c0_g1~~TRINITY_DN715_c0_g1_i1.p4  ORF type:complete len:118 (-),score=26.12 TRINITY_DN715_c0_g1_i1:1047-1400(-)